MKTKEFLAMLPDTDLRHLYLEELGYKVINNLISQERIKDKYVNPATLNRLIEKEMACRYCEIIQ